VLLIGAGGGVGNAAAQIARRLGARVIGADRRAPRPDAPINAIAEKLIIGAEDLPAEVRAATGNKGADVVLDLVGGVMFPSALKGLASRGRLWPTGSFRFALRPRHSSPGRPVGHGAGERAIDMVKRHFPPPPEASIRQASGAVREPP
jgi:NADPH:quinone reductase-like Zn-dependent oxidoreductase